MAGKQISKPVVYLVVLAAIAVSVLGAWWFFLRQEPVFDTLGVTKPIETLDTSVLSDPRFRGLRAAAVVPPISMRGRIDPFKPYESAEASSTSETVATSTISTPTTLPPELLVSPTPTSTTSTPLLFQ